jgi:hypothetical protein
LAGNFAAFGRGTKGTARARVGALTVINEITRRIRHPSTLIHAPMHLSAEVMPL